LHGAFDRQVQRAIDQACERAAPGSPAKTQRAPMYSRYAARKKKSSG
jgi:hypothetical protein